MSWLAAAQSGRSIGQAHVRRVDALADERRHSLPSVRAEDGAEVADEEPDRERREVEGAVDLGVDVLRGGRVDGAVGIEDAEQAERGEQRDLGEPEPHARERAGEEVEGCDQPVARVYMLARQA